jgi:hypothetical protein
MTEYPLQSSFAHGEVSPRLRARVDLDQYKTSLAECLNFIVLRQGGLRRRPGFKFIARTKSPIGAVRLVPFIFSADQAYVLELGNLYMRFFTLDGQVQSGGSPYEIATPWTAADLADLQFAQTADVCYVTHKNYPAQKLERFAETNWTIVPVAFQDGPYQDIIADGTTLMPGGTGNIVPTMTSDSAPSGVASASKEVAAGPNGFAWNAFDGTANTAWNTDELARSFLQYTFATPKIVTGCYIQATSDSVGYVGPNSSVVIVTGAQRTPKTFTIEGIDGGGNSTVLLTKANETGWGDGERRYYSWKNTQAFIAYRLNIKDTNSSQLPTSSPVGVAIATWALSGGGTDRASVTLTASSITPLNKGVGFLTSDVGRHVRFLDEDAIWHWYEIASRVSATQVNALHSAPPLPSTKASVSWRMGAFSGSSGYPARVALYQERVFYARTNDQPQSLWGSQSGDFDNFAVSSPLVATDAVSLTLADVGEVQWLADIGDLIIATNSTVRPVGPADKNAGFSATNFQQGRKLGTGAKPIKPVPVSDALIFVDHFGLSLRATSYSWESNGYVAPDFSVVSEHLFRQGATEMSYAPQPNALVWTTRADGELVGVTYEKEQETTAFHKHELGGSGVLTSQCVIPRSDRSALWAIVTRGGLRTVELMQADYEADTQTDAFYVDCGLAYSGSPVSTVTGLDHLNGMTVAVYADGAREDNAVVSGGAVSLASGEPASDIKVGLPYTSRATTLPLPQSGGDGSGLGRKKRAKAALVNLLDTMGLEITSVFSNGEMEEAVLRDMSDTMDEAIGFFTGNKKIRIDDRWENGGVIVMETDDPGPCTILAVTPMFDAEP